MHSSRRTAAPRATTTTAKPSLMQRLRGTNANRTTTTKHSTNPITGSQTTTTTEKVTTHPHHGHHSTGMTGTTGTTGNTSGFRRSKRHHHTTTATTSTGIGHHHQRRPSFGDKVSGAMMRLKGSLSGRSGKKAAGTRRMRGTDGRGAHW